jgi:hypothetical protein
MKQTTFRGSAVFRIGQRTEWPMLWNVRATRKDAVIAFKKVMYNDHPDSDQLFKEYLAAGRIRVGRILVTGPSPARRLTPRRRA